MKKIIVLLVVAFFSLPVMAQYSYKRPAKKEHYVVIAAKNGIAEYIIEDGKRASFDGKDCNKFADFIFAPYSVEKISLEKNLCLEKHDDLKDFLAKKIIEYTQDEWKMEITFFENKEMYVFKKKY